MSETCTCVYCPCRVRQQLTRYVKPLVEIPQNIIGHVEVTMFIDATKDTDYLVFEEARYDEFDMDTVNLFNVRLQVESNITQIIKKAGIISNIQFIWKRDRPGQVSLLGTISERRLQKIKEALNKIEFDKGVDIYIKKIPRKTHFEYKWVD